MKILLCSVAKVELLVLKMKSGSRCIGCPVKTLGTNLDCAFKVLHSHNVDTNYSIQTSRKSY